MRNETMNPDVEKTIVKTALSKEQADHLRKPSTRNYIRRSSEAEVKIIKPREFFKDIDRPVTSRLDRWMEEVKNNTEEQLDTRGFSRIIEVDANTGNSRWRVITTWGQFKESMAKSEAAFSRYQKLREQRLRYQIRQREDSFGGFGFAQDGFGSGMSQKAFPVRPEYTPLIGSPFFKQLYLYDYWSMHSKCFWWSNYSGIAKMVVDITRNFVMGGGFTVVFSSDNKPLAQKADDAWKKYEDWSRIQEKARLWCDDFTRFGENMLRRVPTKNGILHKAFDPSTCWEIVTEPTDISDVKYYHIQYNTQYQLYGDKNTPISKYVLEQLPPEMVIHNKVNVTDYEKRGRADLLAPLLYFKYYEDYLQARLVRSKNEAAFIWDVTIKGGDEDLQAYMSGTESMVDVPPGSENVHNEAIERKAMSPMLSATSKDNVAMDILSIVAMGTSIPASFFGTLHTTGGTKAGAVVGTEPVVKKMAERQNTMKALLRTIVLDVMREAKIDMTKVEFEISMPDILEGDSQAKVTSYYAAKDEKVISHKTMSHLVAKELKIQRYDYEDEQSQIADEAQDALLMPEVDPDLDGGGKGGGLTPPPNGADNSGRDNKSAVNDDSRSR